MTVRLAKAQDMQRLLHYGEKFHTLSQLPCGFSRDAFADTLNCLMSAKDKTVLVTDGGMIGGAIIPAYCDPDWRIAVEMFWYSQDGHGLKLMNAFERWAFDNGANEVRMSAISALEKASRIYTMRGYTKTEESWAKWH